MKRIDELVAAHLGPTHVAASNQEAVHPRSVAMYLMRQQGFSLSQIGLFFRRSIRGKLERYHHTTVLYAVEKIAQARLLDSALAAHLAELEGRIAHQSEPAATPSVTPRESRMVSLLRSIVREELQALKPPASAEAEKAQGAA